MYWTGSSTIPATSALIGINEPWVLTQSYLKISLFTCYAFNFSTGDEVDIQILADLGQFGSNTSHGAVIGRKGLVKPDHIAANGSGFF